MGTEIFCRFERRNDDGTWSTLWPRMPHPLIWFNELLYDAVYGDSALSSETETLEEAYNRKKAFYEAVPLEEVEARFGSSPIQWTWPTPVYRINEWSGVDVEDRDYEWFVQIAGVGLDWLNDPYHDDEDETYGSVTQLFEVRGVPDDVSPLVAKDIEGWGADAHSHSWLMISEIVNEERLAAYPQAIWCRGMFSPEDYDRTRMVFYFDN